MSGLIGIADALTAIAPGRRNGLPNGVLLVASGGLGDAVLFALVVPRFARLAKAGEPVGVLMRTDAAAMSFLFPPGIGVETVDHRRFRRDLGYRLKTLRSLYARNVRLVVSTDHLRHPELDEALVRGCRAAEAAAMEPRPGAKHARRLARNRALYARLFDSGPARRDKLLRWAAFADWLSGRSEPPPLLRIPTDRLPPPASPARPTVIIQPFSAVAAKQSPPELYRRILAAIPADHAIAIAGGPGDLDRHPAFKDLIGPPRVVFDGSPFAALVPLLRAARLVVSVDTALLHLAVIVGAPTLGLASAAFVGEIVPYAPEIAPANAHILYHSMPCEGCLGTCILPAERGMYPCVARLDGDEVVAKVQELLAGEADGG